MDKFYFDGQQSDEIILYTPKPHPFRLVISTLTAILAGAFFIAVVYGVAGLIPIATWLVRTVGVISAVFVVLFWIFWIRIREARSVTYLTDRRIMRFDPVSPVLTTKRALFWNEVLKAKAYSPNIFLKMLNIGNLVIEPHLSETENIVIKDIAYADDLASYIDKILYLQKNKPGEIISLKPFIAKPRGKRG